MKSLEVFTFNSTNIRVVAKDNEPWFVHNDACAILGIANASDAINRLSPKGVGKSDPLETPGGMQQLTIISEPNLYRLAARSNKPEAQEFMDWVFEVVLPQIRKTGSYGQPATPDLSTLGPDALTYLAQLNQGMQFAIESAQKNQVKADGYDKFLNAKGLYTPSQVAKMLGVKQKEFFQFLYTQRVLIPGKVKHNLPYAEIDTRWYEVKTYDLERTNGHARCQTFFTPYGIEQLRLLAIKCNYIAPTLIALPELTGATA